MEEMKQGEDYEELDVLSEEYDEEGAEDTESDIQTIFGIEKNKFIIMLIAGVLIILVLALVVGKKVSSENTNTEPTNLPSEDFSLDEGDSGFVEEDTTPQSTNPDVKLWGDTATDEEVEDAGPDISSISTDVEIQLRKAGYTGDEISYALDHGFNTDALIEAAAELHQEAAKEALAAISDTAGDEYKALLNYTYLGQPEFTVSDQSGLNVEDMHIVERTVTKNVDYVKCPPHGYQLYLKCKITPDTAYWYAVTPQRWCQLPDAGNIVLKYIELEYGDHTYITSVTEADNTLSTVDSSVNTDVTMYEEEPEDSGEGEGEEVEEQEAEDTEGQEEVSDENVEEE